VIQNGFIANPQNSLDIEESWIAKKMATQLLGSARWHTGRGGLSRNGA
jgi:hypothetical protein